MYIYDEGGVSAKYLISDQCFYMFFCPISLVIQKIYCGIQENGTLRKYLKVENEVSMFPSLKVRERITERKKPTKEVE